MKVDSQNSYQLSFRARCAQIREMQRVLGIINTQLPSFSFSKHYAKCDDIVSIFGENSATKEGKIALSFSKCNEEFEKIRPDRYPKNYESADYFLQFVKNYKKANCGELAILSYIILKMNGFNNVYVAGLKKGNKSVDHAVCLICRDGSVYNKKRNNNNTIIVDPWVGQTGFYNEMMKKYPIILNELAIEISKRGKWSVDNFYDLKLSDKDIKHLRLKYPELLYKVKPPSLVFKISDYISSKFNFAKAWFIEKFS